MSFKTFCQISLKVIVAGAAAFAVFMGFSKLSKDNPAKNVDTPETSEGKLNPSSGDMTPNSNSTEITEKGNGVAIIDGLKRTQDLFGRFFVVIQSLILVVENLGVVFKKGNFQQPLMGGNPWCNNYGYGYGQPIQMNNGDVWRRISPYIIEAGNCNYQGNQTNYPF